MFTKEQLDTIVALHGQGETREDIAKAMYSSPSNISRALHERKVIYLQRHKADWEIQILDVLKAHGLETAQQVSDFITKAKRNEQQNRT